MNNEGSAELMAPHQFEEFFVCFVFFFLAFLFLRGFYSFFLGC